MNRTIKLIFCVSLFLSQYAFGQTYNYPKCNYQAIFDLRIVKVTRGDYSTVIDFEYVSNGAKEAYILLGAQDTDGAYYINADTKTYKLRSTNGIGNSDGITIAFPYTPVNFSATFDAIPKSVKQFDLIEGGSNGSWHFYGVNLVSNSNFEAGIKTLKSEAKMRESDSPLSNTIFTIPAGKNVKVLSLVSGYYKVEYDGKEGFINEVFFQIDNISINNSNSSNNSSSSNIGIKENCDNVNFTSKSSKPDFKTMLTGVKKAVIMNSAKINGHVPAFNALVEYLQSMGFDLVEYFGENYVQQKNLCEEVFVTIGFGYDLEKFYNITMTFSNMATGYTWDFSTSKIVKAGLYSDPKYNFEQALREMYGYKKNNFNSYYTMKLDQWQTCWTENNLRSYILSKGCDKFEGIYENTVSSSKEPKYRIGIKKMNGVYYLIYISGAYNTDNWKEGEIKATLEPTATTLLYKTKWVMADKSVNNDYYLTFEQGLFNLLSDEKEKQLYIKLFPSSIDNISKIPSESASSGTGYAISSDGYIVTNNHVTNGATSIKVRGANGDFSKTYSAKIIIEDKNNDLSIIKIEDPSFNSLGTIPYVIANRASDVGTSVFVLGYPLRATMGDEVKLTNGIISSKSGFQGDVTSYQITAPVQPGNSGGPLFEDKGNIIGIINAKHTGAENASYAIKASYLLNLIDLMPTPPKLQTISSVTGKPLTEQVKILKKFTYILEINQ